MRVVYGAGAVAAVSVMAVGLVQPDYSSGSDAVVQDPAAADVGGVALVDPLGTQASDVAAPPDATPNVVVRHQVRYVQLKPGQTAPPGAKVIQPDAPTPRVVYANVPARQPTTRTTASKTTSSSTSTKPAATKAPAPKPAPTPTAKTKQSGKP